MEAEQPKRMTKPLIVVIIILIVIFGGTFSFYAFKQIMVSRFFATFQPPPVTISTTSAKLVTWDPYLTAVGSLKAVNGVEVSPELSGQVMQIFFQSGQMVTKGQPLVQLDDEIDQQSLANDVAQLDLDKLNYSRQTQLLRKAATSQSALDEAKAKLQQAQARVKTDQVTIAKKLIKAPFAGKIGIRNVDIGQYVKPGDALVTLQALDPLFVDFTLPEQDIAKLNVGQVLKLKVDAYPNDKFTGKIVAINSRVDVSTRNIEVRGEIPNPNSKLYPGVFAEVEVLLPSKENVVVVPETAVTFSLYGDSVYVIVQKGKDKKSDPIYIANQRYVTIGDRQGTLIAIDSGLKAGETVVTSGQLKLHQGVQVLINNSVKLD